MANCVSAEAVHLVLYRYGYIMASVMIDRLGLHDLANGEAGNHGLVDSVLDGLILGFRAKEGLETLNSGPENHK